MKGGGGRLGDVVGQLFQLKPEQGAKGGERGERKPSQREPRVASSAGEE